MDVLATQFAIPRYGEERMFLGRAKAMDPVESDDIATKLYVDVAATSVPQLRIIYLSSAGVGVGSTVVPDGKSLNTAFNNIEAAIAAAANPPPTSNLHTVIWCSDSGSFTLTAHRTLVPYAHIYAPSASLNLPPDYQTTWALTMHPNSRVTLNSADVGFIVAGSYNVTVSSGILDIAFCTSKGVVLSGDGGLTVKSNVLTGEIAISDTFTAFLEGGRFGTITMLSVPDEDACSAYIRASNLGHVSVAENCICYITANQISTLSVEDNTDTRISLSGNYNFRLEEAITGSNHRVRVGAITEANSSLQFQGPFTVTQNPSAVFTRIEKTVTACIPAFGGAQSTGTHIHTRVAVGDAFIPGTNNVTTGSVMCIDNGTVCMGTWTLAADGFMTIVKNGQSPDFSGTGDLYIGAICFGYILM